MNKIFAIAGALCAALAVAACQTTSSGRQAAGQTSPGVPANYKELIAASVWAPLKDPDSIAGAEITEPYPAFIGLLNGGTQNVVCVRYGLKKSSGGYSAKSTYLFSFRKGGIQNIGTLVYAGCGNQTFQPFPELERGQARR
ncbi:hypothetical protein ACFQU1_00020 [Chelatococcus sp. GCM10030263]|uniref:hypothetical protein n=1 Tax=Chelatococcus sp. GCM10030263 TaxID=3273387 RepID=UPI003616B432